MLVQILKHTPLWVFGLFFGLAYLGYLQSKTRLVSWRRVVVLTLIMLCLSFLGMWSSFGLKLIALIPWTCALLVVVTISLAMTLPRGIAFSSESGLFVVPGSWLPFVLMMGIFFTRYAVAVAQALSPVSVHSSTLVVLVCTIDGLCSGIFLGRALRITRAAKHRPAVLSNGAKA